jgi:NADH:ubiquinone oxidoreductase subunit 5 (subunit L)/multisubunit Na+/H+ antiporter MnhA subunit
MIYAYVFQMQRTTTTIIQPTTTVDELVQQEETANEKAIWIVFRKMLFFTVMMTVAPLSSFYFSKDFIFEGIFHMENNSSYIYSAFVAVVIVHIILFAFVYVAFRDDGSKKKTKADLIKESAGKKD